MDKEYPSGRPSVEEDERKFARETAKSGHPEQKEGRIPQKNEPEETVFQENAEASTTEVLIGRQSPNANDLVKLDRPSVSRDPARIKELALNSAFDSDQAVEAEAILFRNSQQNKN